MSSRPPRKHDGPPTPPARLFPTTPSTRNTTNYAGTASCPDLGLTKPPARHPRPTAPRRPGRSASPPRLDKSSGTPPSPLPRRCTAGPKCSATGPRSSSTSPPTSSSSPPHPRMPRRLSHRCLRTSSTPPPAGCSTGSDTPTLGDRFTRWCARTGWCTTTSTPRLVGTR